jgi:DNA-binding NarL/FixJ family response regulator
MSKMANPITAPFPDQVQARILLVDDHDGARRAMRMVLEREDDLVVCGEAASGMEAMDRATRLRPDVIVMDVGMPRMNGLQAAEQLGKALPDTPVLLVSLSASEFLVPARRGTIYGLVSKQDAAAELPRAVHAVLHGDTYFRKEPKPSYRPN